MNKTCGTCHWWLEQKSIRDIKIGKCSYAKLPLWAIYRSQLVTMHDDYQDCPCWKPKRDKADGEE
jgi:hypothetical protein